MADGTLRLSATTRDDSYQLGVEIPVEVHLTNASANPMVVNGRLAMGYQDGLIRELYMTVYDAASGDLLPVPDDRRIDAHRMPPTEADFVLLEPSESVSAIVDIGLWFPFETPGRFRVHITYVNDESGAEFGFDAFVGSIEAEPFEVILLAD